MRQKRLQQSISSCFVALCFPRSNIDQGRQVAERSLARLQHNTLKAACTTHKPGRPLSGAVVTSSTAGTSLLSYLCFASLARHLRQILNHVEKPSLFLRMPVSKCRRHDQGGTVWHGSLSMKEEPSRKRCLSLMQELPVGYASRACVWPLVASLVVSGWHRMTWSPQQHLLLRWQETSYR